MSDLGGYYSQFSDDQEQSLNLQQKIAEQRRLEPADIKDFFLTANQSLRDRETKYSDLNNKFAKIQSDNEKATIGLERLRNIVSERVNAKSPRIDLQRTTETLANIIKNNQNIGYILNRCRRALDEAATVAELAANTIRSELADRHKKVASQKELALRLRDIDELFEKCSASISDQQIEQKKILDSIQELLHIFGIKLPDNVDQIKFTDGLTKAIKTEQNRLNKKTESLKSLKSKLSGLAQIEDDNSSILKTAIFISVLVIIWLSRHKIKKLIRRVV